MSREDRVFPAGGRLLSGSILAAVVGVLALLVGAVVSPRRLLFAYLVAYDYVVTTVVGALIFLMICHAMRATWPIVLRRLVEAIVATFPVLLVLFLPIALGLPSLYPWIRPETIASEPARRVVERQHAYLNVPFFLARAALYFAIWIVVGHLLRRWSVEGDEDPRASTEHRMYAVSAALLPLVALAASFASFDWLMSLTPGWSSTMYPVYWFAGGFLNALALLTVLAWTADRTGLIQGINASHFYALGRLLLAFVIFWAYAAFFQLLLIWIANKPEEVVYYLERTRGGFGALSVVLVLTRFVVPFFVLLSYEIKRRPGSLAAVAAWILGTHYIDVHWLVTPAARPQGAIDGFLDVGALLAVAGVTVAYAVWRLRGLRAVPVNDAGLPESLRYDSL